nr:hypothetical protein [Bacteroidota bacterium]
MKKIMLLFLIIPNFSFAQINETLSYADGSKMDVFILNINPDSVYAMRVVNGMEFKDWISSHQIMNYEDLYTEYRYLEKKYLLMNLAILFLNRLLLLKTLQPMRFLFVLRIGMVRPLE